MLTSLYLWTLRLADHPRALWALALISFIESSVFPIPPDVLMIPMILARPSRAWLIATVALVASVLGGLLGYAIGVFAFEQIGQPILSSLGKADAVAEFNTRFNDFGFWAVLAAGVTPFPSSHHHHVGLDRDAAGHLRGHLDPCPRGALFLVAALLWKFGAPIRDFIENALALSRRSSCCSCSGASLPRGIYDPDQTHPDPRADGVFAVFQHRRPWVSTYRRAGPLRDVFLATLPALDRRALWRIGALVRLPCLAASCRLSAFTTAAIAAYHSA